LLLLVYFATGQCCAVNANASSDGDKDRKVLQRLAPLTSCFFAFCSYQVSIEKETYICISRSCMSPNKKTPRNYLLMVVKGMEMVML
jgi:hypothetical protein